MFKYIFRKSNDSDSSKKSILVVKPVISIVPKALTKVEGNIKSISNVLDGFLFLSIKSFL